MHFHTKNRALDSGLYSAKDFAWENSHEAIPLTTLHVGYTCGLIAENWWFFIKITFFVLFLTLPLAYIDRGLEVWSLKSLSTLSSAMALTQLNKTKCLIYMKASYK